MYSKGSQELRPIPPLGKETLQAGKVLGKVPIQLAEQPPECFSGELLR